MSGLSRITCEVQVEKFARCRQLLTRACAIQLPEDSGKRKAAAIEPTYCFLQTINLSLKTILNQPKAFQCLCMCTWFLSQILQVILIEMSYSSRGNPLGIMHGTSCFIIQSGVFEVSSSEELVPSFYQCTSTFPILERQISCFNITTLRSKFTAHMELMILPLTAISCCLILIHCSIQFYLP